MGLQNEYASKDGKQILNKTMSGPTYDVLSRVFMALSKIKIIAARKFQSADGYKCVQCSFGPNQGLLYPLEKSIFFIWKPVTYIRHADIAKIEILRMEQSHNIKMFDLSLHLKKKEAPLVFTGIDRAEYENLIRYFMKKANIKIQDKALHESRLNNTMLSSSRSTRTRKNIKPSNVSNDALMSNFGGGQGDDDDEEDDDYYDKITTPMDIESEHNEEKNKKRKKKKKKKKNDDDDDMMIGSDQDEDMQ